MNTILHTQSHHTIKTEDHLSPLGFCSLIVQGPKHYQNGSYYNRLRDMYVLKFLNAWKHLNIFTQNDPS